MQIALDRTGAYSSWFSWLNGKVERHIQTACIMLRIDTVDHGLGDDLWCCKYKDVTQKYKDIIHSAHGDSANALWYGRKPCAREVKVFGCKVEDKIGTTHQVQLNKRME